MPATSKTTEVVSNCVNRSICFTARCGCSIVAHFQRPVSNRFDMFWACAAIGYIQQEEASKSGGSHWEGGEHAGLIDCVSRFLGVQTPQASSFHRYWRSLPNVQNSRHIEQCELSAQHGETARTMLEDLFRHESERYWFGPRLADASSAAYSYCRVRFVNTTPMLARLEPAIKQSRMTTVDPSDAFRAVLQYYTPSKLKKGGLSTYRCKVDGQKIE